MLGILCKMDHNNDAIGYIKVFTTEGRQVRDRESYPLSGVAHLGARRNIAQWVYTYTEHTCDAARRAASEKANEVLRRLRGRGQITTHVLGNNAVAFRVGNH